MIYIIQDILNFTNKLNSLWSNSDKYSYIYTSIGSKYNQRLVTFNTNSITMATNSIYQMTPRFIIDKPQTSNKLIIIFDKFTNENLHTNMNMLKDITIDNNTIDIFIVNTNIIENNISNYIQPILNKLEEYNISSSNFLIANYVQFQFPNTIEYHTGLIIPEIIQNILNTSKYNDCFYNWNGYSFYTYNYIYKYNKHIRYILYSLHVLFINYLKNEQLSSYNIKNIIISTIVQKKLDAFTNYSINIIE
jgi:hypothetical protein